MSKKNFLRSRNEIILSDKFGNTVSRLCNENLKLKLNYKINYDV